MLLLLLCLQDPAVVLETACVRCHRPGHAKGGLDLSTREALMRGGDSGPVIDRLLTLVRHEDEPKMPHRKPKLDDRSIAALAAWVDAGAPYARPLKAVAPDEVHWAFAPLRPSPKSIDALRPPGPEAPREVLLRRLAFGVAGLPPGPDDGAPWEAVVDRLLASPAFGERWARHWLDVARYADSTGYESDYDRPHAWRYRDFVVRAFNEDLPFDAFVRRQVAGDLLDPPDLAATGFLAVGPWIKTLPTDLERNKEKYRYDNLDDVVSTTAQAFLGLTLGCARCHDHKYDPLPQRDYYRLVAVFAGAERRDRPIDSRRGLEEWLEAKRADFLRARIDRLPIPDEDKRLLALPEDRNIVSSRRVHKAHGAVLAFDDDAWMTDDDRSTRGRLEAAAKGARGDKAWCVVERPAPTTHLLARGEPDLKKEVVEPGVLSVLGGSLGGPSPRLAFAAWLTDVERGAGRLLARVIVNRVWQHHFGAGLVATPDDFGTQGEKPSHPELLDALAARLVANGWSLKALHREILASAAYREVRPPQRLDADALRDALLAVSGRLDPAAGGPSVRTRVPAEAVLTRSKDAWPADAPEARRRSLYLFRKRSVAIPFLETFDAPAPDASCGRRDRTTVAIQALALLNDPLVRDCAQGLASRAAGDPVLAWRLALGRAPRPDELAAVEDLPFDELCHALLLCNEFAYVD